MRTGSVAPAELSPGSRVCYNPRFMEKPKFFNLTLPELTEAIKGQGKEGFRAQQLFRWIHALGVQDFDCMTNFSKEFRKELPEMFDFQLPEVLKVHKSVDGTTKLLFNVGAGKSVEAVLIPSTDRMTICLSSEVGCNMACKFCYTGKQKLQRR